MTSATAQTPLQASYPQSELVFGVVAPVGVPDLLQDILRDALKLYGYGSEVIKLSSLLDEIPPPALKTKIVREPEYDRIDTMMDAGNEVRERAKNGAALALYAVSKIYEQRGKGSKEERLPSAARAHLLFTLKHPEEVHLLRRIYGPGFFLIGVHSPEKERRAHLTNRKGMTDEQAALLIKRDESDERDYGQRVRDTFFLADVFVRTGDSMERDVSRFIDLVFGSPIEYPKPDEHAMFLAYAASLRSGDLSRQVGAVVVNEAGDVVATGCNDVPRFGGGQYPSQSGDDQRDYVIGYDSNAKEIAEIARDTVNRVMKASVLSDADDIYRSLRGGRLYDLTEFGRIVHAEMEALTSCARSAVSPRGGTLFTTTFPCHNCAKHIIAAGVVRVVYVEPYPKSQAFKLHRDAIKLDAETEEPGSHGPRQPPMVHFRPFVGIGARRFFDLFSMNLSSGVPVRRKESTSGDVRKWVRQKGMSPRVPMWPATYIEREELAVRELQSQRPPLPLAGPGADVERVKEQP